MLEPRFVERVTFFVVGAASAGQMGEFNYGEIWEKQYMPMDKLLKPLSIDGGCYGVTLSEDDHLIYLAGVAATENAELPQGAVKREIHGGMFAVFDCVMSTMIETMQEVNGEWFHISDKELDPGAVGFEYYPPYNGTGEMRVEMYIPVKPKESALIKQEGTLLSVFDAITNRRSIRKFKSDPIPEETIRQVLQAGILAPSGSNRQPWKFYVVQGKKHVEMTSRLHAGLARLESEGKKNPGFVKHSFSVMEQAPVSVFVFYSGRTAPWLTQSIDQHLHDVVEIQSIGAAIQNMLLAATELGLGSLWIADVFEAREELSEWLGESSELIAAVSLGYPDEHPIARKRKAFEAVVQWV